MAYTYDDAIRLLSDHYGPITKDWLLAAIAAREREKIAQIEEQSRLQDAFIEAYEAHGKARQRMRSALIIKALGNTKVDPAYARAVQTTKKALDAAWAALQAHTNGETR